MMKIITSRLHVCAYVCVCFRLDKFLSQYMYIFIKCTRIFHTGYHGWVTYTQTLLLKHAHTYAIQVYICCTLCNFTRCMNTVLRIFMNNLPFSTCTSRDLKIRIPLCIYRGDLQTFMSSSFCVVFIIKFMNFQYIKIPFVGVQFPSHIFNSIFLTGFTNMSMQWF